MEGRVTVSEQKWISIKTRTSSGFKAMAGSSPQWWHVIGEETETLSLEALKLELREETQGALVLLKGEAFTGPKEQEEVKWLVRGHELIRCRPGTRAVPPASGPGSILFHATCLPDQWLKLPLINCGPKCVCLSHLLPWITLLPRITMKKRKLLFIFLQQRKSAAASHNPKPHILCNLEQNEPKRLSPCFGKEMLLQK